MGFSIFWLNLYWKKVSEWSFSIGFFNTFLFPTGVNWLESFHRRVKNRAIFPMQPDFSHSQQITPNHICLGPTWCNASPQAAEEIWNGNRKWWSNLHLTHRMTNVSMPKIKFSSVPISIVCEFSLSLNLLWWSRFDVTNWNMLWYLFRQIFPLQY